MIGVKHRPPEQKYSLYTQAYRGKMKKSNEKMSLIYAQFYILNSELFFFFIKMGSLTVQPKYFKSNISVEDIHIAEADCIISEIYRISDKIYKLPQ